MINFEKDDLQALRNVFEKVNGDNLFLTYFFQSNDTQMSEEVLGEIRKNARVLASVLDYVE